MTDRPKWEHFHHKDRNVENFNRSASDLAGAGWELVAVVLDQNGMFNGFFKRQA